MTGVTVETEAADTVIFGHTVSDLQTDLEVADGAITGTLHYVDSGALATAWGAGNFMVLKFSDLDPRAVSVKVGLDESVSSGLVEIIGDPDMNGVFKVTNKDAQVFVVESRDSEGNLERQTFDLSGLTLEDS